MQNETEYLNYFLPEKSIKQEPYKDPDKSKLLIASTKKIILFKDIDNYIPDNSIFVFNKSKVQKVRILEKKLTGGKIEIFILELTSDFSAKCLIKSTDKKFIGKEYVLNSFNAKITDIKKDYFEILFSEKVLDLINNIGVLPLPPYIKEERYKFRYYNNQFSENGFSVASPTAGLHFSLEKIQSLKEKGHDVIYINLDVNLGTFKPINTKYIQDHKIHSEKYHISEFDFQKLLKHKKNNKNIICVGTTSLRTIESVFLSNKFYGETDLFILPDTKLNLTTQLITNFHAPKSSLLSIVQNVYGENWKELYTYAITNKMKFLSFGDAVLFDINE